MIQAAVALLGVFTPCNVAVGSMLFFVILFPSLLPAAIPDAAGICLLTSLSMQPLLYRFSATTHAKQAWMKIDLILLAGPPAKWIQLFLVARDSKYEFRNFLRAFHYVFRLCLFRMPISARDFFVRHVIQPAADLNPAAHLLNTLSLRICYGHHKFSAA